MKNKTITANEFAILYGCSPQYVTRKLRSNTGILPMINWYKSSCTWLVVVPVEWVEGNKCVTCGKLTRNNKVWKCKECGI